MAINKKLIHFQKLATFKKLLDANNILDTSIVFIKDSQQIWTHGLYYSIADAPADNNSYVRKNNGWVISPSSGVEIYIGKDLPSSDYKLWVNSSSGDTYYYTEGQWVALYEIPPKDLSLVDIYGNGRASATTANCYVVKEKGVYKFPLVYGNAIVNGTANSASYTKASGSYSLDFVNGSGTIINTPFIEQQESISNALLSITDTNDIFTNVKVISKTGVTSISDCGYILFKVNSIPATGANAVISAIGSSGNIIWNWHIWVWSDDLTTKAITNKTGVTYNILPYNLASKWDDLSKTYIKNWFYQWGRSVPMLCPSSYNSTTNSTSYGVSDYSTSFRAESYKYGIASPTTFYYNNNSPYNWFGTTSYYNLWDANCTTTGTSDNVTVKTVYDPCPPGFKIPNGNTFTGFSTGNGGSWSYGYTWSGSFFPASGFRNSSGGALSLVGSSGTYWSSAAYSQDRAYYLNFSSGDVYPQDNLSRAGGFSVRPVAES